MIDDIDTLVFFAKSAHNDPKYSRDACEASCNSSMLHPDDFTPVIRFSSMYRFSK